MISSRSFELEIIQGGTAVAGIEVQPESAIEPRHFAHPLRTDFEARLELRGPTRRRQMRVRICGELALVLREGEERASSLISNLLRDRCGEAPVVLEIGPDEDEGWIVVAEFRIPLQASDEVARLYDVLLRELERAHVGLAQDILGNLAPRGCRGGTTRLFEPGEECQRLERNFKQLDHAIQRIGNQPASQLIRERVRSRWRPGDLLDNRGLSELARSSEVEWSQGVPSRLGRILRNQTRATNDLPEHRHLRREILHLARRADQLSHGCVRAADLMSASHRDWGLAAPGTESVYERQFAPRVVKLERLARQGEGLAFDFRRLVARHDFIAEAGKPRTRFGPTPLFLGRPAYREAFETLTRARSENGYQVDGQGFQLRIRSLDRLFEYWCYVVVVEICREALGAPSSGDGFQVVDELYRPDLKSGQFFGWELPQGVEGARVVRARHPADARQLAVIRGLARDPGRGTLATGRVDHDHRPSGADTRDGHRCEEQHALFP